MLAQNASMGKKCRSIPVKFYEVFEQVGDLALSVYEHYYREIAPIYLYQFSNVVKVVVKIDRRSTAITDHKIMFKIILYN